MRTKWNGEKMVVNTRNRGPAPLATGIFDPVRLVYSMSLLGATITMMCEALGITQSAFQLQLKENPQFLYAYRKGREIADSRVAKSLYHKALGYSHKDTHISVLRMKTPNGNDTIKVVKVPVVKHYPPDVHACIFWLKNKQPKLWRDTHKIDISDPNQPPSDFDLSGLTDEELAMAESLGLAMKAKQAKRIGSGSTDNIPQTKDIYPDKDEQ